jgi:hypothetical protein
MWWETVSHFDCFVYCYEHTSAKCGVVVEQLRYKVTVVSRIDWHRVQRSTVLCFRILSAVIFGYFYFPVVIIFSSWGLHFDACHIVPQKKLACLMKDLRSLQKCRRIQVRNRLTVKCLRLGLDRARFWSGCWIHFLFICRHIAHWMQ